PPRTLCRPNSYPTRRSSDLTIGTLVLVPVLYQLVEWRRAKREARQERRHRRRAEKAARKNGQVVFGAEGAMTGSDDFPGRSEERSEEHTSELQSRFALVCRL